MECIGVFFLNHKVKLKSDHNKYNVFKFKGFRRQNRHYDSITGYHYRPNIKKENYINLINTEKKHISTIRFTYEAKLTELLFRLVKFTSTCNELNPIEHFLIIILNNQ